MVKNSDSFDNRYIQWLDLLDKFCGKHKVNRRQAVSILFLDNSFDVGIVADSLYWEESYDFAVLVEQFENIK